MIRFFTVVALLLPMAANAQTCSSTGCVMSSPITGIPYSSTWSTGGGTTLSSTWGVTLPMAHIANDGAVQINWPRVEAAAAQKSNDTTQMLAQALLAVRDGTWKPLP